jgi:putative Holliday junction resolvase
VPRRMGIDYGIKRMGVAVCDPAEMFATPLCVVPVRGDAHAAAEVKRLIDETGAESVVVGLPVNMNGTKGPMAEKVEAFAERIRVLTGVPVTLWDERLTSAMAERTLIEADVRRDKRKNIVDMLAAQSILQSYMDSIQRTT